MAERIPLYLDFEAGEVKEFALTDIVVASVAVSGITGYPADSTKFLRGDATWAVPTASVAITETEIDLGTTPVAEAEVIVADGSILTTSKIIGGLAYKAPTGKDLDEIEMDAIEIKFEPNFEYLTVHIKGLEGYLSDKFIIWYTFA